MTEKRLFYLLEKHHSTSLSKEEADELSGWYDQQQQEGSDWIKNNQQSQLIEEMSATIMNKISKQERPDRKIFNISPTRWVAAASIVLLTGLVWLAVNFLSTSNKTLVATTESPTMVFAVFDTINNNTKTDKKTLLPDGSTVIISSQSVISYQRDLSGKQRDIFLLNGKVFFDVKADKTKPFVVHANNISTTALGTSFTVIEDRHSALKIQLHTGKVVVQSNEINQSFKPVYLDPGKEVVINTQKHIVAVRTTPVPKAITKIKPETIRTGSIVFEQDSLTTVFRRLSVAYKTNILYDSSQISRLEFTGTIKIGSAPDATLTKIALLNGLTVSKTEAGYVIIKP